MSKRDPRCLSKVLVDDAEHPSLQLVSDALGTQADSGKDLTMTMWLILLLVFLCTCSAMAEHVVLSPADGRDSIALVKGGQVQHMPAKRVELVESVGGGGACRYIRRSRNGDLYVTGVGLEGTMLKSTDGGHTWTRFKYQINDLGFVSAFAILNDDTFLIAFMSNERDHRKYFVARSTDLGKTWQVREMNAERGPYSHVVAYNADMIQIADGTVLLTGDFRVGPDGLTGEQGEPLPLALVGTQPSVVRSTDGGLNWTDRTPIVLFGGEAHLIELPSGTLLAASRYQRNHRIPGDPLHPIDSKLQNGFRPQFDSEEFKFPNSEKTNRVKNIFLSESHDGGRTWVNERRVTSFLQCPGDLVLLPGGTLVLTFLHRYPDDVAHTGIRAIVSDDQGATWRDGTYIISHGEGEDIDSGSSYPTSIAMENGTIITVCGHFTGGRLRLEAVHWKP